MTEHLKWAISTDQHIPYHNPKHIELWFKFIKAFKPHVIDYLGDTSDQDCFSKYSVGTSQEFLAKIAKPTGEDVVPFILEQERPVREFYEQTRKQHPKADIHSALGNHCVRIFDYVDRKIPDEAKAITPNALWGLDDLGIGYIHYSELPKHRYGDIFVHHGVAISQNAGESVKKDVENFGVSILRGHSHRAGTYFHDFELTNKRLRGFEAGHMTDIKSPAFSYTQLHNWQSGFMTGHIVDGYPHLQFHEIIDNSVVVDGKIYSV